MRKRTCCFTGHRKMPPGECQSIAERLEQTVIELTERGIKNFCAGGAVGFDSLAANTVLKLREEYPHIKLTLILPCLSQTRGWAESDIEVYEAIKEAADEVIYTSRERTRGCMQKRNRALVERSGVCVCYLTKSTGGTAYTVKYANKQGLQVINLAYKREGF